jgi:hypothetical protein
MTSWQVSGSNICPKGICDERGWEKYTDVGCAGYISKSIDIHDFKDILSSYVDS